MTDHDCGSNLTFELVLGDGSLFPNRRELLVGRSHLVLAYFHLLLCCPLSRSVSSRYRHTKQAVTISTTTCAQAANIVQKRIDEPPLIACSLRRCLAQLQTPGLPFAPRRRIGGEKWRPTVDEHTALDILARLRRVENENRRLKQMGLGLLVLAGVVLLIGQSRPSRTIEGEKFILLDANGRPRARLEMEMTNVPTLVLLDEKGFPSVSLGAGEDPTLTLCKGNCEKQAQLSASKYVLGLALYEGGGNPMMVDQGKQKGLRAGFGVINGVPGVNLFGKGPNEQASLDLEAPGPRLYLSDQSGSVDLEKASLEVSDEQGFSTRIGRTELETPRTGETHKTSAASIVLFDKDSKRLWSAP